MVQYFRELFFFVFLLKFNFFFHLVQNQTIRAAGTAWKQLCALCWGCFLSCMWLWWTQLCFTGNQRKNFFHLLSSGYWNVSPQNENQKKKPNRVDKSFQIMRGGQSSTVSCCVDTDAGAAGRRSSSPLTGGQVPLLGAALWLMTNVVSNCITVDQSIFRVLIDLYTVFNFDLARGDSGIWQLSLAAFL